jgi:lysophospholipase L1-like esterase
MSRRVLFAAVVFALFAGASEGIARAWGDRLMPERRSLDAMPGKPVPGEPNMVADTTTGWRAKTGKQASFGIPDGTFVNSRGLRGPEIPVKKPANKRRILFVGDSTVFGVLVRDGEIFPRRVEARLQQVDPRIEVLDGATPGWSSWQARRALEERLLDYQPDLVVIATLWSDTQGAEKKDAERFAAMLPLLDHSMAYVLLREWVNELRSPGQVEEVHVGLRPPGSGPPPAIGPGQPGYAGPPAVGLPGQPNAGAQPTAGAGGGVAATHGGPVQNGAPTIGAGGAPTLRVPLDDYRANLRAMASLARGAGADPAFLVLPCVKDPTGGGKVGDFRDTYRDAMRDAARELNAPIADTPGSFVGTDPNAMFLDEVHPTAAGHARIAEVVDAALEPWVRAGLAGSAR